MFCPSNSTNIAPAEAKADAALLVVSQGPCSVACGGGNRSVEYSCWVRGTGQVPLTECPLNYTNVQPCNQLACNLEYVAAGCGQLL